MNRYYEDLMSLTTVPPSFFQKDGVPRWEAFLPGTSTDVYANEAVTLEIACQGCDGRFHVLIERSSYDGPKTIADSIRDESLHYGDPPNVRCCDAGPTMNSEPVRILGYWLRDGREWERDASLEIPMRRFDDPLTDDMRREAEERLDDPGTDDETRKLLVEVLASDDERRAEEPSTEVPVFYSQYREAAPREETPL